MPGLTYRVTKTTHRDLIIGPPCPQCGNVLTQVQIRTVYFHVIIERPPLLREFERTQTLHTIPCQCTLDVFHVNEQPNGNYRH